MQIKHTAITVLESRWWSNRNTSVRATFDLLSDLECGTHHGYNYEMCNSSVAFTEAFSRYVCQSEDTHYLSVASHGAQDGLQLYNGDVVSRAKIRNILKRDEENRTLSGLHFGSCFFGTQDLAAFLHGFDISPWWIAGYGREIDFVQSTVLDLIFFQQILANKRAHPLQQIKRVSEWMRSNVSGLVDELKFNIYLYNDGSQSIEPLL